jgi:transitional endoplasmic reticulum ATPase
MDDLDSEFDALLQSCAAHPDSAILIRALMVTATKAGKVPRAADFLAGLLPPNGAGNALQTEIRAFLREAGVPEAESQDEKRQPAVASVVRLADHRSTRPDVGRTETLTFADVGGLDEVKRQIHRRIIAPQQKPGLFARFGRRAGGGTCCSGHPAAAKQCLRGRPPGEAHASFIEVAISEILDHRWGHAEKRLVAAFAEARQRKPSILFFDEIEALAAQRNYAANNSSGALVSTFLSTFDGLDVQNDGVLVFAATNVPWAVDSAFRRPGRFDRVIFVPPPDREARLAILRRLLHDRPVAPGLDVERYVDRTSGFSGADLTSLVETAIDLAIEDEMAGNTGTLLSRRHLDAALEEIHPTTLEWLTTARNYAKYAPEPGLYGDLLAFLERHQR